MQISLKPYNLRSMSNSSEFNVENIPESCNTMLAILNELSTSQGHDLV